MLKDFKSNSVEYETPDSIFIPLKKEFNLEIDLAASETNHKLEKYFSKEMMLFNIIGIKIVG